MHNPIANVGTHVHTHPYTCRCLCTLTHLHTLLNLPQQYFLIPWSTSGNIKLVDHGSLIPHSKDGNWSRKKINTLNKRLINRCYSRQQQKEVPRDHPASKKRGKGKTQSLLSFCPGFHGSQEVASALPASPIDTRVIFLSVLFPFYVYILFSHSLSRIPLLLVSSLVFTETFTRIREVEETPFFPFLL